MSIHKRTLSPETICVMVSRFTRKSNSRDRGRIDDRTGVVSSDCPATSDTSPGSLRSRAVISRTGNAGHQQIVY